MARFEELRALFRRRLLAAVIRDMSGLRETSEYEEELQRQRRLQRVIRTPEIKLRRAGKPVFIQNIKDTQGEQ